MVRILWDRVVSPRTEEQDNDVEIMGNGWVRIRDHYHPPHKFSSITFEGAS